jgi:hypothetical protein
MIIFSGLGLWLEAIGTLRGHSPRSILDVPASCSAGNLTEGGWT